ncbi:flagellar hook-associated protein FlgL [Trinickia mobilis]|uniref:flagellar hook-associated protein FlgL n=1 Tax=Trinickia mobilis TaxID=2816356 RepID=UPI001A8E96E3|nr:flagellar hook-associated protein FlgL [Trinickia mobilis]
MRVSTAQYAALMNATLQNSNKHMTDLMQQIATGQRILRPSDDPINSVRLSLIAQQSGQLAQYQTNIDQLGVRLQKSEAYLSGITQDMTSARDLMVWASDGSAAPSDLNAMAQSIKSLRDSIMITANSRDSDGNYLFSGTATDRPALSYDPNAPAGQRYTFTGNTEAQMAAVGNGTTAAGNVSLDDMAELLNRLDAAAETASDPDVDPNDPAVRQAFADCLDQIDAAIGTVSAKTAQMGASRNMLAQLQINQQAVGLANDQATLQLGQVDYGSAMTELNGYMTAVQATQKVYGRVMQMSLFDVL